MKGMWRDWGSDENSREQSTYPVHMERPFPMSLPEEFTNPESLKESLKELLIDLRGVIVFL